MQELNKTYNPETVENKWYEYWQQHGFFRSVPNDRPPYTIVIPPPNVTGVLHMGHMLNNTIQDVLIRRARMKGYNALWVPGTDHASIATEAKVVQMLREKGIKKSDLSRDEFLKYAWEWKEKYGGIILKQLEKLGASCDWSRTRFTMDTTYYRAVIKVFVDLYNKGFIYRGLRMINWDCEAKTALSNEEVQYAEGGEKSHLYSVRYKIQDTEDEWVIVATQRPETIMGDTAIAVNPTDPRFMHLIGKTALVPLINRPIPIIADNYVDVEFGTGCLKVTPAHDPNDYEIGLRHNLPVVDTINLDGTLNEACEIPHYVGLDRFKVRKLIIKDLEQAGHLVKTEDYIARIGRSERTGSVVEPKLSLQWFIKMKEISQRALQAVENDEVQLIPAKYKNTYRHWMENVRDWCISRQLWWGHRIPAYYYGNGENDFVVAETEEQALQMAKKQSGNQQLTLQDLRQDEDVLDTWASSWLWPIAVFDGFEDYDPEARQFTRINPELQYYYPTNVLVTAPEILFFWVARMIIAGYEYMNEKPFKDVYLTGIVRDKLGRKMSKSLGNSPDPLELMAQYSADGVRTGMLFSSPAGNDLPFDEKLCEQGRNFANKIWNALRLVKGWTTTPGNNPNMEPVTQWFESKLAATTAELDKLFEQYRLSEALTLLYRFIWDDYCSVFLELVKPDFGQPIEEDTYQQTIGFFEQLMKLLHPFMPFITEEVYQHLYDRAAGDSICISPYPVAAQVNATRLTTGENLKRLLTQLREVRAKKNLKPKDLLPLYANVATPQLYEPVLAVLQKKAFLSEVQFTTSEVPGSAMFMIGTDVFHVGLGHHADASAEREHLQKELDYFLGFKQSVLAKLNNEKFAASAPAAIVEKERAKLADAEQKIAALQDALSRW
ncbi:valine--tRNA ligase [Sphingobacteriales bacterium UPWRP_1]|nr:valine--tRNA ligase [Sphingobacteriales bacterium TSM_CSM]PSJ78496.1 valine--tRNA ligase [Sphingobacteriales bacterium UPWRP_1]